MDEYFLTKKAVEIILDNLNEHFIKCLVNLSIQDRYADNTKLIIGIYELVNTYFTTRRNDILSSCIKYTNKSYYLHLSDSLFRLIQNHLANANINNRYLFINDLITKYNNPIIPFSSITRNITTNTRTRFNSGVSYANEYRGYEGDKCSEDESRECDDEEGDGNGDGEHIANDAGTLFKEAYNTLKTNKRGQKNFKDIELSNLNKSDLL
jgi:hypothetical protein